MNADLVLRFDDGFDPKGYFTDSGILRSLKVGSSTSLPSLRIILICVYLRPSAVRLVVRVHSCPFAVRLFLRSLRSFAAILEFVDLR